VFDNDPQKIGRQLGTFEILDVAEMPDKIRELGIEVAIVAVPAGAAQQVVDDLVSAGVRAILNYAPISVSVPPGVRLQYIDPVTHLQHMTYYLE
jgi:redox-sensing transcriptional repressor